MLSWLIEGARKVIAANYQINRPQCVLDAIGAYREGNDWLGNFINECCDREIRAIRQSPENYIGTIVNTVLKMVSLFAAHQISILLWNKLGINVREQHSVM